MKEYKGFPISNFRTGFNESVEPWLLPRDAFPLVQNAHLYRGVIEKVNGYSVYAVMSYRRMVALSGAINGFNKHFTGTLSPLPVTENIYIQATTNTSATAIESFTSDGTGLLTGSNGGTGTVDFTTGAVDVTFGSAAPAMLPAAGPNVYNAVFLMYDAEPPAFLDIMGIKQYYGQNGSQEILVFDTKRVGKVVDLTADMASLMQLDYGISEIPHQVQAANITTGFDGTPGPFTGTITGGITPGTVTFLVFDSGGALLDTITDNGKGLLTGATLNAGLDNFINYLTGAWILTFTGNQAADETMNASACVFGDVFSGDFTDFFSVDNYQAKAFVVNNVDLPRYYDGTCLMYLNTSFFPNPIDVAPYDISSALHVVVYRNRLLLLAPTVNGIPQLNTIYYSQDQDPLNFSNIDGITAGNALPAPTSEPIKTFAIINSDLIVRFFRSERIFRFVDDAFAPFRWDSTNNIWRCDGPYSAINYDSFFSSVGKPAIVGSDGVNIQRVDEIIPDFTLPNAISQQDQLIYMDQTSIGQCYGERFDDFKEGWLCFKSNTTDEDFTNQRSNSVLAFNYLDKTYAVYSFPFNCLGFGSISAENTWGDNFDEWQEATYTWDSYSQTTGAIVNLAGDQNGVVYELGKGNLTGFVGASAGTITGITNAAQATFTSTNNLVAGSFVNIDFVQGMPEINGVIATVVSATGSNFVIDVDTTGFGTYVSGGFWRRVSVVLPNVISKSFNPFVEDGELARLGYIDLLLSSYGSVSNLRVQFYLNDTLDSGFDSFYQENVLTFQSAAQTKVWKRIYVGAVGQWHTIRFYQNIADFTISNLYQPVRIHALVPYFKPAGRLFQAIDTTGEDFDETPT